MASIEQTLARLESEGRLRGLTPLDNRDGSKVSLRGREMVNLTSNDYLGIASDHSLHQNYYKGLDGGNIVDTYGLGSASSRLLTGDTPGQHLLEERLKDRYCGEAALLFNSGYHANIGILPALFSKNDLILSDKLNHASLHDGLRLSYADAKRYRHTDYEHLERLLENHRGSYERCVIVTESVFSMDGDVADLSELVRLKKKFDCFLYVDEAHGVGLYGNTGLGKAEEQGVLDEVDLLIGTFGKAFASVGAFLICSEVIRKFLINHSRSLIFTTALPPVTINWNLYILNKIAGMGKERNYLLELSNNLRDDLREKGLSTDGATNIIPVIIGDNSKTVIAAEKMRDMGYLVFPVRPPTVPEGTSRFRLSLTSAISKEDIRGLAEKIRTVLESSD